MLTYTIEHELKHPRDIRILWKHVTWVHLTQLIIIHKPRSIVPRPDLRLGQGSVHTCLYDSNFMWIRVLHGTGTHFKNCHSYGTRTHLEYLFPYGTRIHLGIHLSSMDPIHSKGSNPSWDTNHWCHIPIILYISISIGMCTIKGCFRIRD